MGFRFKSAAAVAVGTFNIYIIQPNWLGQIELIGRDVQIEMEADFSRPGFRFRVSGESMRWNVHPDRIVLDTEDAGTDCGRPLADVLRNLRWTPLFGIGTNLVFEAPLSDLDRLASRFVNVPPKDGFSVGQRTSHVALIKDKQTFNLQIATPQKPENEVLTLSINVHTSIEQGMPQLQANEMAIDACNHFIAHRDEAASLARDVFGIEVNQ